MRYYVENTCIYIYIHKYVCVYIYMCVCVYWVPSPGISCSTCTTLMKEGSWMIPSARCRSNGMSIWGCSIRFREYTWAPSPGISCSTCTTLIKDGNWMIPSARCRSSVVLPTPLRPTNPYLTPKLSAKIARSNSSCLPARMQMSSTWATEGVVASEF